MASSHSLYKKSISKLSLISPKHRISDETYVIAVVHDVDEEAKNEANAFILVERLDEEGRSFIHKYRLPYFGESKTEHSTYFDFASLQMHRIYIRCSNIFASQANPWLEKIEKELNSIDQDKVGEKFSVIPKKDPRLFSSLPEDTFGLEATEQTHYDWVRSKILELDPTNKYLQSKTLKGFMAGATYMEPKRSCVIL